jgi:hypothetical protein
MENSHYKLYSRKASENNVKATNVIAVSLTISVLVIAIFTAIAAPNNAFAWQLTVDLSNSDFGDDRVCANVEGGYGYGPYYECTSAGSDAEVTFNIGNAIEAGENVEVCGYSSGLLDDILQGCESFVATGDDMRISADA